MVAFEVQDMSCGHCVSTITKALKEADPGAQVQIDLARHRVEVTSTQCDALHLREVIAEAGYTPQPA